MPAAPDLKWPSFKPKANLEVQVVEENQIYVIDDFFSADECSTFLKFARGLKMEAPRPPGRNEATRTNYRFETYSAPFATTLYSLLSPHLPLAPFSTPDPHISLFPKIRIYHYPTHSFFGPHYDDTLHDPITSLFSKWTLLIYLTGEEDGVEGGGTVFHKKMPNKKGKGGETVRVELRRGRLVLHRHGRECMLHEGEEVREGEKWVLRSDLMYE